jgi:hypothetical protein
MKDEKLIVLLFAFRYAVHRIGTQALAEIEGELNANLETFPDWMLAQMQTALEGNFDYMERKLEETGKITLDDDCRFQQCLLDAIKEQRTKLAKIGRGTTNGNKIN